MHSHSRWSSRSSLVTTKVPPVRRAARAWRRAGRSRALARRRLPGMDDPFYLPLGNDRWRATVHTTGPWDARFQHGGPPSALLARAIEQCSPRDDMLIARMTVDILGAIPVDEVDLGSRMLRPGRSVELGEAALSAGGREVARAQAWRVLRTTQKIAPRQTPAPTTPDRKSTRLNSSHANISYAVFFFNDTATTEIYTLSLHDALPICEVARAQAWRVLRTTQKIAPRQTPAPTTPPLPAESTPSAADGWVDGYLSAVEWRFTAGAFGQPGPATAWTRLRPPIVPGEPPSPLQRVLAVADSGNGISGELDLTKWHFINPELTVHLHREAVGEWICLEAQTAISPGGVGLATSVLSDLDGPIGVGAQSLLIAQR